MTYNVMQAQTFPLWAFLVLYDLLPNAPSDTITKQATLLVHWLPRIDTELACSAFAPRQLSKLERSYSLQELADKVLNISQSQLLDYYRYGYKIKTAKLFQQNAASKLP